MPNAEQFELTPQTIKASQEQESGFVVVSVEFAIDKNLTTGAIAVAAIGEWVQYYSTGWGLDVECWIF